MLLAPAPSPPTSPTQQSCLVLFTVISNSSLHNFLNWGFVLLFSNNSSLL